MTLVGSSGGPHQDSCSRGSGAKIVRLPGRFLAGRSRYLGLVSPDLVAYVRRSSARFDVVHVHMARDFVTLSAAAAVSAATLVVQTHGMHQVANRLATALLGHRVDDVLSRASVVLALTEEERRIFVERGVPPERVVTHPNFTRIPTVESFREPSATPQVLFLSRLHARKRPLMFIEAAALVAPRIPAAKFVLVGPDGGEAKRCLSRIAALGVEDSVSWQGPARDFELTGVLDASAIYVHSARDEPFGLTIIEALARGVPVVVTESAALAPILRKWRAGTVVGDSAAAIASGVSELLQDPALAQSQVRNGLALVTDRFSGDAQRALLLSHYQQRASPLV